MTCDGIIASEVYSDTVDGDTVAGVVRGSMIRQMQAFDGEAERSI